MLTSERIQSSTEDMAQDSILHMRISEELRRELDELRKQEPDLPSRSEMVRRLILRARVSADRRERKGKK